VRLQRELFALTSTKTENQSGDGAADEQKKETEESKASSDDNANEDAISTDSVTKTNSNSSADHLPPFITVEKHILEIENAACQVWFNVDINSKVASTTSPTDSTEEEFKKNTVEDMKDDDTKEEEKGTESSDDQQQQQPLSSSVTLTVILDASFKTKRSNRGTTPVNAHNEKVDSSRIYPFSKPVASLHKGAHHLPSGSTLQNGDFLSIDCDWTPSLHLSDAIMNVALKLRESIKRGEPLHDTDSSYDNKDYGQALVAGLDAAASDVGEVITQGMTQSTNNIRSFITSVRTKAQNFADELDKVAEANAEQLKNRQEKQAQQRMQARQDKINKKNVVDAENVEIGDVIDLSQSPWSEAVGLHSCKAIRRPEFVDAAIKIAGDARKKNGKVAGTGLSVTNSFFSSFRASAKSIVEETYLMITPGLILEISCNKFSVASATVTYVVPVSSLVKLKFRREESLSLFFRQAVEDPAIYMCQSSAEAVKQLQGVLKGHGVKGKHTNATIQKSIKSALDIVTEIGVREKCLDEGKISEEDGKQKVEEIMNLYRQAAEIFESAGDERHEEVMRHMRVFLAKPLVAGILDNSGENGGENDNTMVTKMAVEPAIIPEGEILEGNEEESRLVDNDDLNNGGSDDFHQAMQAAEDMLNNAHSDLQNLGIDDIDLDVEEDDFGIDLETKNSGVGELGNDVVSEFEDMLKDADKEIAELMDS